MFLVAAAETANVDSPAGAAVSDDDDDLYAFGGATAAVAVPAIDADASRAAARRPRVHGGVAGARVAALGPRDAPEREQREGQREGPKRHGPASSEAISSWW
jgi:hypothetical protein